ncbi:HipA domain-containing protein [Yersinia enterocolitica]
MENLVIEIIQRDLLNIAFGNSDNHGRNTVLIKRREGIWFAPIYDFAPMKADPNRVFIAFQQTAQKLIGLKSRLKARGVPEHILNMPGMAFIIWMKNYSGRLSYER